MMDYQSNLDTISSVFKIGNVISVEGKQIKVLVDKEKNSSHLLFDGDLVKNVSVGSHLKITKGFEIIYGKIEGEYIKEEQLKKLDNYTNKKIKLRRILVLSLLGFLDKGVFKKGIKELPLIDNECYLITDDESRRIHDFVEKEDHPIDLGSLALEKNQRISFGINSLMASHIGIFGNTGSGKSYTLSKLYNSLFKEFKDQGNFINNAKFVFFDFNGEYIDTEKESGQDNVIIEEGFKNIYELSTRVDSDNKYPIAKQSVKDVAIWRIIFEATEKTQTPFLDRVLKDEFLEEVIGANERLVGYVKSIVREAISKKVNKATILNMLNDIYDSTENTSTSIKEIESTLRTNLEFNGTTENYYFIEKNIYQGNKEFDNEIEEIFAPLDLEVESLNLIQSIHLRIILKYYNEIIKGYSDQNHIAPLIKRVKRRINDLNKIIELYDSETETRESMKNITIISLKNVNIQMRKILPLIICKELYENHREKNDKTKYLNIIIDEAHNILSSMSERESQAWKDYRLETFEEIIKEGRKFGIFLTIASQRPSDISPTIISQLHNYFLHRLINNRDIQAIDRTVSYLDKVSYDSLSILPTGTCIIAGTVSQLPVIVEVDEIDEKYKPFNQTIKPYKYWVDES